MICRRTILYCHKRIFGAHVAGHELDRATIGGRLVDCHGDARSCLVYGNFGSFRLSGSRTAQRSKKTVNLRVGRVTGCIHHGEVV